MVEPLSRRDYYTKAAVAKYILEKSGATLTNWVSEGKVFEPTHVKNTAHPNGRRYYSLADAMMISIMVYGSIELSRIYNLVLDGYIDDEVERDKMMLSQNSFFVRRVKEEIRTSMLIVRDHILNKAVDPVDLSPFLVQDPAILSQDPQNNTEGNDDEHDCAIGINSSLPGTGS